MAYKLLNRATMSVSGTPGTGDITLGSAASGQQSFSAAGAADTDTFPYVIEDGADWEFGTATYNSTGPTISRTTVAQSSAGGTTKISATASATVYCSILGGNVAVAGLADASVASPTDGQVLAYSTLAGAWTNQSLVAGGVINFDPAILPVARVAMANVRSGTGRMKIAFVGDSTTAGQGAGTSGGSHGARNVSVPAVVAELLAAAGVPATSNSAFSDGGLGVFVDSRLTFGTGWIVNGPDTLGGKLLEQTSITGSPLAFTPSSAVDKCDFYYVDPPSSVTFTFDYDGSGTITTTGGGTLALLNLSLSPTLGTHTFNVLVTGIGANPFYCAAFDCYSTATPEVSVWNWGVSGFKSADFTTTGDAWSTLTDIGYYAPDLTIIDIGINDETASVSYSTFYANVQTIITEAKLSGDVILVMHHACSGHTTEEVTTLAALTALAAANNLPLVNFAHRLGSYAQANTLGEMFDVLHCLKPGYADEAKMLASLLLQL